jgi:hypothetical protein
MLFVMKRFPLFLTLLLFLFPRLSALSVTGPDITQPFDSREELAQWDFSAPLSDEERSWAQQIDVSIIIMGPTNPVYGWFGHAAIMVRQPGGHAIMYDYGVFDNTGADFYFNFLRGRMLYSVWATDGDWRIEDEKTLGRYLAEYKLDFTPEQKVAIFSFLQENVKEENRTYLYHFYKDNCATRLRDILDEVTGGDFKSWLERNGEDGTYRSWAEGYMTHSPFISFVLNFIQGREIDKPITEYERTYLPESLASAIESYEPFHAEKVVIQEQDERVGFKETPHPAKDDGLFLLFGILSALLVWFLSKREHQAWGKLLEFVFLFVLAFLGTLLVWGMCFSDIDVIWYNEAFLIANPALFAAGFMIWKHPEKTERMKRFFFWVTIALTIAKGLFPELLIQDDIKTIFVVLPYYFTGFTDGYATQKKDPSL